MANGHIENHNPLPNNNLTSHTDCKSTSDTDSMEDTAEFRVMMAYAQRRRPKKDVESPRLGNQDTLNGGSDSNGTSSPQTPDKTEKEAPEKKKGGKKRLKALRNLLRCVKPQTDDDNKLQITPERTNDEDEDNRCGVFNIEDEVRKVDKFDEVASRLMEIADEIPFTPPDVEVDSPEDDVEKVIGLLLRESGDRLNERELKNASIFRELFWDYNFFETLITKLLERMGLWTPDYNSPGPQTSPKTQIAIACEATSRLSVVDTVPMNRLLGFGATYLQNHFSSWASQQGGYEAAFESDDEDVQ